MLQSKNSFAYVNITCEYKIELTREKGNAFFSINNRLT